MQLQRKISSTLENHYLLTWLIIILLTALYAPLLLHWYDGWLHKTISIEHEYFSHGIIGLPFAAYIVWSNRKQWYRLEERNHLLAIPLLLLAAICYLSGIWDLVNLSLTLFLAGLCLWLKGLPGLRLNGFALLLVLLATPTSVPYLITPYTLPLQKFIATTAGFILIQGGIEVAVKEIYLAVGGKLVEVAPYCAGLKMLFTSLYVSLMVLYWTETISSQRKTTLLLSSALILSVVANIVRNTMLTFFHGTGNEAAFAWLHDSWGGDMYSACLLGAIVLLHSKFIEKLAD